MSDVPANHELARKIAILEEPVNTMQADPSATLERIRADMVARDASLSDRMVRPMPIGPQPVTGGRPLLVGAMATVVGIATAAIVCSLNI